MIETEITERSEVLRSAHQMLEDRGWPCKEVIHVDRDSILFLDSLARPRTAWVRAKDDGKIAEVRIAHGFAVDPPAAWANPMASAEAS